jgi:hypothetical protein
LAKSFASSIHNLHVGYLTIYFANWQHSFIRCIMQPLQASTALSVSSSYFSVTETGYLSLIILSFTFNDKLLVPLTHAICLLHKSKCFGIMPRFHSHYSAIACYIHLPRASSYLSWHCFRSSSTLPSS